MSVIGEQHLKKFGVERKLLTNTKKKLVGPDHKALNCLGCFETSLLVGGEKKSTSFYVCEGVEKTLLGRPALQKFNMIEVYIPETLKCASICSDQNSETTP